MKFGQKVTELRDLDRNAKSSSHRIGNKGQTFIGPTQFKINIGRLLKND